MHEHDDCSYQILAHPCSAPLSPDVSKDKTATPFGTWCNKEVTDYPLTNSIPKRSTQMSSIIGRTHILWIVVRIFVGKDSSFVIDKDVHKHDKNKHHWSKQVDSRTPLYYTK